MSAGRPLKVLYLTDSLSELDGVGRYAMGLIAALERANPDFAPQVLLARKHRPTSEAVPAHWRARVALPPDYFFYMAPSRFWPDSRPAVITSGRIHPGSTLRLRCRSSPSAPRCSNRVCKPR